MRSILHCDLNAFFASVECVKNPKLKNVPMAVCGDPSTRHGVILAKNELAKKMGVVTAETIYSAKQKCKNLVLVKENHADYIKYSQLVNQIYLEYTDRVEPFGIDESFLDITQSLSLFGDPYKIAYGIKEKVKQKYGLTISVGISFNKSLAKLGSDMKKPDAITVLAYENYKEIINSLPVSSLLYVGRKTNCILEKLGILTIGDLARYPKKKLVKKIGKLGEVIYNFANGIDFEEVRKFDDKPLPKSVSKGMTFKEDLTEISSLEKKIRLLSDDIATQLRMQHLECTTVGLHIKDYLFTVINRQRTIHQTNLFQEIANAAISILKDNYIPGTRIRAITVSTSNLIHSASCLQLDLFHLIDTHDHHKLSDAVKVVDHMREKYGIEKVTFGSLINL